MITTGPEKTYENKIKRLLKAEGCYYVKHYANAATRAGIPDILACIGGHFVGIEVKAANGKATELQLKNILQIREAGGIALIVYPDDYDRIKKIIRYLKLGGAYAQAVMDGEI